MQRIFIYTNMAGELFQSLFLGEFILFLNQVQTYPANSEASEKKMWTLWRYFKQMFLNLQNFTSKWTLEAYTYSSNGKVEILCTQFGFWVLWKVSLFLVRLPCLHPRSARLALKLLCFISERNCCYLLSQIVSLCARACSWHCWQFMMRIESI